MSYFGKNKNRVNRLEHVETVIGWLIIIGVISMIVLFLFGLGTVSLAAFGGFVLWAVLAALASLLVGGGMGLLFGLPTVRRIEFANPAPATTSSDEADGETPSPLKVTLTQAPLAYDESTNLEHVADWLTKIIIGLTLTQYSLWEERFARLSYDVGYKLLGTPACDAACARGIYPAGATIPGGALMIFYAVLGFLIAYLWMRGYFITEMEGARSNARARAARDQIALQAQAERDEKDRQVRAKEQQARLAEQAARVLAEEALRTAQAQRAAQDEERRKAEAEAEAERQRAREQGVLQERATVAFTPEQATEMTDMVSFTADEAQAAVGEIKDAIAQATDPDDPWRGQFGGSPEGGGLRLSATATQTTADPHYYDVLLKIEGTNAAIRTAIIGKSARVFLHPTFGSEPRTVYFGAEGVAQLQLLAYGAFTVGVLVEDGTKLELNLATIEGVDPGFLSR